MVWQCVVPNCDIAEKNNPSKLSGFSAPKDMDQKNKWKKIVKCDFNNSSARVFFLVNIMFSMLYVINRFMKI